MRAATEPRECRGSTKGAPREGQGRAKGGPSELACRTLSFAGRNVRVEIVHRRRPSPTSQPRTRSCMKAIVIHEFGPPDVLKYEDVPDPQPEAGEIRIRVHAATVNRVLDVSLRAGKETRRAPTLPLIPGVDCAGKVDALGPGVTRWQVGQHVAAAGGMPLKPVPEDCENYDGPQGMMGIKRPGGFAELVCVPACVVVPL